MVFEDFQLINWQILFKDANFKDDAKDNSKEKNVDHRLTIKVDESADSLQFQNETTDAGLDNAAKQSEEVRRKNSTVQIVEVDGKIENVTGEKSIPNVGIEFLKQ